MATLEQIQIKLKKLQAQADTMLAKKTQSAVDKIRELMLEYGLTTADIEAEAKVARAGKTLGKGGLTKVKAGSGVKAKGLAKYQHPITGATWSGHGRAPAWIADAKDRTKFLIESAIDAPAVGEGAARNAKGGARKSSTAARSVAHKGQPKGPQPAMYRDPKSGATWSGRGRAPSWIGADRSKFLIDGVATEQKEAAASVAAKPRVSQAIKATVKKGAATKVATKKAATKKVATAKKASVVKAPAKKAATTPVAKKAVAKKVTARKVAAKKVELSDEIAPAAQVVPMAETTA